MMSHPIRVLYLQPAAHFGGAERQAATVVPSLYEQGVHAIPYVGPGREIVDWLEERGVDDLVHTQAFPGAEPKLRGLARAAIPWRYGRCLTRCRSELERVLVERNIDLVFAAMAFSWIAATPVARALGLPIIWRAGGTECPTLVRGLLAAWASRHRPDRLICNGETVARMFGPMIGAPTEVVRNGLDGAQFRPGAAPPRLRPAGASVVIGFAGRLVPQKRPQDFIAAAARFADRDDVVFLVAGEGSRRTEYELLAVRRGARTLSFVGYVRDMREFYASCDVLVLPSRSEGCPNVVLEAQAMGTVAVASDAPATREILTHDRDGLLYPIGDIDALCALLARLVEHPGQRRLLVSRARARVAALTATTCAARTAEIMREVATSSSSAPHRAPTRYTALRV